MGTRSLTVFVESDRIAEGKVIKGQEIAVLYRQYDGYYKDGHGQELVNFLKGKKITNGIGMGATKENAFNGMNCLTAAVIAHFKDDIGGFYLYPAGTREISEEFIYTVTGHERDTQATVTMLECYADKPKEKTILKG